MIFIPLLRKAMCTHPNVVKTLPLDCTVSIGKTFRPYNGTAFSQFELDECSSEIDGSVPKELLGKKDRKSVVYGKSVSVRVVLGGRGIIKKKNMMTTQRLRYDFM